MATIVKEINLKARPEAVWDALRDFQAVHTRVAPGFLTDSKPDGDNARLVSFANGSKFREILVSCDDTRQRLVYSIPPNERLAHYNAAAQVVADGKDTCRFVWTIDLLPDAIAADIGSQMDGGLKAIKAQMERG